ncbi:MULTISPECIES: hypothetical protein [unclassified Paraburkholderia]|uniref:hypothetical protein n=1 Tax=unclassified Paraburkholderia TaxID=2615204 RepID=UPI00160A6352|nr:MULTISPECIES: hypothetical protein [unclassified Paraburkholderia]MBB5444901.1 hypothetical protein [Paraburkholderia sp. WSM4177]MBB5483833.1 hypothetical protein [Paraburkholderia sp. WSM4180]
MARFSAGPAPSGNGDRPPGCLTFGKLRAWLSDWYDHAFAVGYIHPNDSALHERIGALHFRAAETIARKNGEVNQRNITLSGVIADSLSKRTWSRERPVCPMESH